MLISAYFGYLRTVSFLKGLAPDMGKALRLEVEPAAE